MTIPSHAPADRVGVAKGAAVAGAINAVINGAIQWFLLAGDAPIPLSVDAIGTAEHTVLGSAVPLAVSLAMILTAVAHLTARMPKRPFWPDAVWLIFKHGFFAFGIVVSAAVVWQRAMGTVEVSLAAAVTVLAVVAGAVAAVVNYMTTLAIRDVRR